MKVLVTGANGMLGSALCPILTESGGEVYPTDINNNTENKLLRLDITDRHKYNP